MKIKYRIFDDNDYTEVKCDDFSFSNMIYPLKDRTKLEWVKKNKKINIVFDVCEVCIEEI